MARGRRILEHAPGVYEIPSLLGGSIRIAQWVVVGSDGAALVDTGICGTPAEVIAPALEEAGLELGDLTTIVLSHCDVDHIGGTAEIVDRVPDVVVAAPAAERDLIESWERLRDERYRWVEPYGLELAPETESWLEQALGEPFMITRPIADGNQLDLGDITLQIVGLPGHSDGLVGVWLADAGVLIAMDAVFGAGPDPAAPDRVNPPQYGAVDRYLAAIDRIEALAPPLLGASHFEPLRGPDVAEFLRRSRTFVGDLEELLLSLLTSEPRSLSDLTDAASAVLGPFRPDFHELARSVCAHLRSLEERGSANHSPGNGLAGWRSA